MDFAPCTPLRCPCFVLQLKQMRQVCQRVAAIRQRCSRAVDSRKPRVHKQFVQVTTAPGYDDCIVASWSENAPPTCVDRERFCKSACREYLRLSAKFDCLRSRQPEVGRLLIGAFTA